MISIKYRKMEGYLSPLFNSNNSECEPGVFAYRRLTSYTYESVACGRNVTGHPKSGGVVCSRQWGSWTAFSQCSSTCKRDAVRIRTRTCLGTHCIYVRYFKLTPTH